MPVRESNLNTAAPILKIAAPILFAVLCKCGRPLTLGLVGGIEPERGRIVHALRSVMSGVAVADKFGTSFVKQFVGEGIWLPEHSTYFAHGHLGEVLDTSLLAFEALQRGNVGVAGATGTLLPRNLKAIRALAERSDV